MLQWLKDVWEGFWTVLVGMKITWRHLFTQKVTLQYPEERWQLPPKSRMRLFMKYEDCIGCGQCVRACPVQCIYLKAEKRPPTQPAIFAANREKQKRFTIVEHQSQGHRRTAQDSIAGTEPQSSGARLPPAWRSSPVGRASTWSSRTYKFFGCSTSARVALVRP